MEDIDDLYYWFEIKQQKAITLTQKLHFCLVLIQTTHLYHQYNAMQIGLLDSNITVLGINNQYSSIK